MTKKTREPGLPGWPWGFAFPGILAVVIAFVNYNLPEEGICLKAIAFLLGVVAVASVGCGLNEKY